MKRLGLSLRELFFFFILGAGTQQSLFRDDKTYVSLTVIRDGRLKALAY